MSEKFRIVVIDDEPGVGELLKSILEGNGSYEVTIVANPQEAETVARQIKPQLVLLDIVMEGRMGTEIISSFREDSQLGNIPIIVVSGKGEMVLDPKKGGFRWWPQNPLATKARKSLPAPQGNESFADAYGVEGYMAKPIVSEMLLQMVEDVLVRYSGGGDSSSVDLSGLE